MLFVWGMEIDKIIKCNKCQDKCIFEILTFLFDCWGNCHQLNKIESCSRMEIGIRNWSWIWFSHFNVLIKKLSYTMVTTHMCCHTWAKTNYPGTMNPSFKNLFETRERPSNLEETRSCSQSCIEFIYDPNKTWIVLAFYLKEHVSSRC